MQASRDHCQAACDHVKGVLDQIDEDKGDGNDDPEQASVTTQRQRARALTLGQPAAALVPPKS
jgi:hypothetical protein